MMDAKQREFVSWLVGGCKTHTEWLTVISYGLPTLLKDQDVLVEVIINEAKRLAEHDEGQGIVETASPAEAVMRILDELGLRLTLAS
jgi:selenophosphate synthase